MDILLGYWLDSNTYPDALGKEDALVGTVVTGFKGLIGILETQLGLTAPPVSENIRIAEWQGLIRKLDTGNKLFSKSFATDSWNTARELLHRRDELVIAGWDPKIHSGGSRWVETLSELELANHNKTWGFSDRVRFVLTKLQDKIHLDINSITIVDEEESMWDPWCNEIIKLLIKQGIHVHKENSISQSMTDGTSITDLSLLQSALAGEKSEKKAQGDGSILLVRSEQEWDAADFLISWLQENGLENTVLVKGEGSSFLDELLNRRGVPGAGVDAASKWRPVLQVLPLTIDTYWDPIRVDRMMELLTIPTSPVPGKIRYRLANELASNPGVGGAGWLKSIEDGVQDYEETWIQDGYDDKEIQKRRKNLAEKIDLWIQHEFYDPNDGIPLEKITQICQKVSQWAVVNYQLTNDFIYKKASQIAQDVLVGVQTLGVNKVTQLQIARIIDSVLGEGAKLDSYQQEASQWEVVEHPGQIWGNADMVVWWGFNKGMEGPNLRTWTKVERAWLKNQGVYLLEEDVRRRREAASWHQAVQLTNRRLILIAPSKIKGEERPIHPLWDEIRHAIANESSTVNLISFDASELRKQQSISLFRTNFVRTTLPKRTIPAPIRNWNVPENVVLPRAVESATSFESLVGCSLRWTFKYAANVRPGTILSLPNESIMLGNLGHAILETLLSEKMDWQEDEVRIRVGELFDDLTPKIAATLLEPENGIKRNETRIKLQISLQQFFKILNREGIKIKHTELELKKNWQDGVEFKGRLDLVGETATGKKVLFDSKWSRKPANYKERLQNLSIQLALYHWLLTDQEDEELPVAYFMLRSGQFFSVPHEEFPSAFHVEGPSLIESKKVVQKSVSDVWAQLAKGTAIAPGVPESKVSSSEDQAKEKAFVGLIEPPCKFCEYQNLCGFRRVTK
ncbi:PD-(D/E)XK nuclease family protein [Globicatella sulfidifaciens]|uniref:PD-(D/E)XK nuclease family protein n=1 Tax=Globicatella sulfidifaciens TaxID=136093 RepID=A0A7X8H030_9LACT|nr:PD-(D/E)XK nuclease family protein [Globicatella sulfidifaciens]NLJ18434.1 PD-(D/E)XK nuclease family protein [Globicatella sulfidifaciens]